jgi:DNA-binding LytR/AlgR family response regulator
MSYTCIAIDDEFPATQVIESLVNKIPDLLLLKSFTKAKEALDYLHNNEVDIIFLDIQMPDLNGLEFIRSLRKKHQIILTTAYDQYALEGFNLEVVDYLLKPFSFDRFVVALNKAIKQIEFERNDLPIKQKNSREDFITVKSDYKLINIPFSDIDYIEGLKAYLSIFVNGKRTIVLDSLKNYELMLPEDQFLRVHKSYIVPLQKIKFMEGNMLVINEKKIPIGKSYKEIVLKKVFKM